MPLETLRSFLGWCAIGNLAFVSLWFFLICFARGPVYRLHRRWFAIPEQTLDVIHYAGMAGYKTATWLFCIIPYLVLRFLI